MRVAKRKQGRAPPLTWSRSSPAAWPAATSGRSSSWPTTPKTCKSARAGPRQPQNRLVARPALRAEQGTGPCALPCAVCRGPGAPEAQRAPRSRAQRPPCRANRVSCRVTVELRPNTNGRFYVKAWSLFARFAVLGPVVFVGVIGRARLGEGGRGAENAPVDAGAAPSRVDRRDLWRATSAVTDHRGCQRAGERAEGRVSGRSS